MSTWKQEATQRRDIRQTRVQDVEPKHRAKKENEKFYGIAYHFDWPLELYKLLGFGAEYYRWYASEVKRDQAFKQLIKSSQESHWRVTRDDVNAVYGKQS